MVDVVVQDTERDQVHGGALSIAEFRAYVDNREVFEEAVGEDSTEMVYRSRSGLLRLSTCGHEGFTNPVPSFRIGQE
jgi:hypothetical protein